MNTRMDQLKFVEDSHFKFFKGCHPQILLGPFSNTLTHITSKQPSSPSSMRKIWTHQKQILFQKNLCETE